ncbi:MAG: HAD family hydrolase [Candidatus Promineifilaceae bacterium]|nr:HAD family hydrolase [Candidatus Promineifilaceae bacterium]
MTDKERRVEAVIFDLDDTLIDWSGFTIGWEELARPRIDKVYDYLTGHGHNLCDRELFLKHYRRRVEEVWDTAREDWSAPSLANALRFACTDAGVPGEALDLEEVMEIYASMWGPVPGVEVYEDTVEVLEELRRRGYRLGLITNSFFPMWMRDVELRHYELIDYFDARIASGDTDYMKPHPSIYELMLDMLNIAAEEALFVGDRPDHDIAGANESGLISVLIDPPHLNRPLDGVQPDYTITRLQELIPVLDALEERESNGR